MLSKQALLQAYRKMREIRTFKERLHRENTSGDIPGFIHLYTPVRRPTRWGSAKI